MRNNKIKLNESQLRNIIRESVRNILMEHRVNHNDTPQQNRRAWADYNIKNGIQDAFRSDLSFHDDWGEDRIGSDNFDVTYPYWIKDELDIDSDYEDDVDDSQAPDFDTHYEISKGIGEPKPRHRIDTHHLEKYGNELGRTIKNKQMDKIYDDYGNPSQYDRRTWFDGMPAYDEIFLPSQKEMEVNKAWDEHDSLNESRINNAVRNSIRKILR